MKADGLEDEIEVIDIHHKDGTTTVEKVDRAFLDLTDKGNQGEPFPLRADEFL